MWASAALLCTSILGGYFALDYQGKLNTLQIRYDTLVVSIEQMQGSLDDLTMVIDLKIDYGDSVVWFNSSRVPLNYNLMNATKILVNVNFSTGAFGTYINTVDGVGGDPGYFWLWYYYDEGEWQFGHTAADVWTLQNGDVVMWEYTDTFPF